MISDSDKIDFPFLDLQGTQIAAHIQLCADIFSICMSVFGFKLLETKCFVNTCENERNKFCESSYTCKADI